MQNEKPPLNSRGNVRPNNDPKQEMGPRKLSANGLRVLNEGAKPPQ